MDYKIAKQEIEIKKNLRKSVDCSDYIDFKTKRKYESTYLIISSSKISKFLNVFLFQLNCHC